MPIQPQPKPTQPVSAPVAQPAKRPAAEPGAAAVRPAEAQSIAADEVKVPQEASLDRIAGQALAQAEALEAAWQSSQSGQVISRTFNTLLGKATGHDERAETEVQQAIAAYRALPADLSALRRQLATVKADPKRTEALLSDFRERLKRTEALGTAAESKLGLMQQSRKFWSGLSAEITSTLLVNGGAVLASRRFGLPLNATTAAAGFLVGGSANLASHALLDSQYQPKQEALGNFLTAGVGSAALVLTAKAGATTFKRMAVTQAVVGAATASVGAGAREAGQGFSAGWQGRIGSATIIGTGVGFMSGIAGAGLSAALPRSGSALVQKSLQAGVGAATGAFGAGAAGTISEGFAGFSEGWQARVKQQAIGGAISGGVLALGPSLSAPETEQAGKPAAKGSQDGPEAAPPKTSASESKPAPGPDLKPDLKPDPKPEPVPADTELAGKAAAGDSAKLPLLDYDQSQALRDFDALVNAHQQNYGAQNKSVFLYDADGTPLPPTPSKLFGPDNYGMPPGGVSYGSGYGYGSGAAPVLIQPDGNPLNPAKQGDNYYSQPPSALGLLGADGQALNASTAPATLIDPKGMPLKAALAMQALQAVQSKLQVSQNDSLVKPDLSYRQAYGSEAGTPTAMMGSLKGPDQATYVWRDQNQTHTLSAKILSEAPQLPRQDVGIAQPGIEWQHLSLSPDGKLAGAYIDHNAGKPLFNAALQTQSALMASLLQASGPQSVAPGSIGPQDDISAEANAAQKPAKPDIDAIFASLAYSSPKLVGTDGHLLIEPAFGYGSAAPGPVPFLGADGKPLVKAPSNQKLVLLGPDGKPAKSELKEYIYSDIFRNQDLRDRTIEAFGRWTSTYSDADVQGQLRTAFANVIKGKAPSTPLEQTVYDIYTTRQARWGRLADCMGLPDVPKDFQLYRGVKSERFLKAVVEAWRDPSSPDMKVPAYELSSWSMTRRTAERFADNPEASVIFEAQVPFELTLADKYVDDGSFITNFSDENEIVVATAEPNGLSTPKDKVTVTFKGQTYSYAERETLIRLWDAAQAAKQAGGN